MEKAREIIEKEAPTVYPVPLTEKQVNVFLNKNKTKSEREILEAWEIRKRKHIKIWRSRYGMDDHKPFGSKPPKRLFTCQWLITELSYSVRFTYAQEPELLVKGLTPNRKTAHDRVIKAIKAQYKRYGLSMGLNKLETSGNLEALTSFEPEHDWDVYKSNILSVYNIKKGVLKQLISAYRKGKSPAKNLKQLEDLINDRSDN